MVGPLLGVRPRPAAHPASIPDPPGTAQSVDLAAGATLVVVAAFATAFLPSGSPARVAATLPVLFLVPGYLLLQALLVPAAPVRGRWIHALVSIGVSPAVVGLLALATALVEGGFRQGSIVGVVTVACLLLALVAFQRRSAGPGDAAPRRDRAGHPR